MIRVYGEEGSREYEAAMDLRGLILDEWPEARDQSDYQIWIIAGGKCHGQKKRDLDLLVIGQFPPGVSYGPFLSFHAGSGEPQRPASIEVRTLCLIIELKDHSAGNVRFEGTTVRVAYGSRWHNASAQNEEQIYSFRNFVEHSGLSAPWVTPLIWLRNISPTDLPRRPHNILGAKFTWEYLLSVVSQVSPPYRSFDGWVLDSFRDPALVGRLAGLFTRPLVPTRLDRQRMERINQRLAAIDQISQLAGSRMVILRGRGGTGKTMRLLQLAKRVFDQQDARVLILTYNKALVADIRRQLTLCRIPDDTGNSSIQIQSAHAFFFAVLSRLGVVPERCDTFLADYEAFKSDALLLLKAGALSHSDLAALAASDPAAFAWDYVLIDEGQDWPSDERELLRALFSANALVIADGMDQLVRSAQIANWRDGLTKSECEVIPLSSCLRMKAGLARFVNAFARALGMDQQAEPNLEAPGGRILILEGEYVSHRQIHDQLVADNSVDGNSPVDMLFCVPPNLAIKTEGVGTSFTADVFQRWGYSVWDGATADVRESYPTDAAQLRIVQYDSCRGLEGWVVVNLRLDEFYEYKRATFSAQSPGLAGSYANDPLPALTHAARWTLIPMTRAIDTLVVQIKGSESPLRSALVEAAAASADVVEWRHLD